MERYIVFDVETPNSANERMSAIGITLVDGREISGGFYSLVDPEQRFDRFNVALTRHHAGGGARPAGVPAALGEDRPADGQRAAGGAQRAL